MLEKTFTIQNEDGLHARPAGMLAKTAATFQSQIDIRSNGITKNAKSIMGIMSLGLEKGAEMTLTAMGPDEAAAIDAISDLAQSGFGHS